MLDRDHKKLRIADFRVTIEFEPDRISTAQLELKLGDSVNWTEGTGTVITEYLGDLDPELEPESEIK